MAQANSVELAGNVAMPLVGLGTWQMRGRTAYDAVRYALDVGYRHIDTATMYGNEAEVGRAVHDSAVRREEIFLTTKLPPSQAGRARATLDASLRMLGTGYVDLWLIHWPVRASVPTWREFLAVRDEGLARCVGVSNYSIAQVDELIDATGQAPAVNQVPWSPGQHDAARLAASRSRGVVVEGYSPLKGSDLRHPVLTEIARRHRLTAAQVVLRWHVEHGIPVIPKSVTPARIAENFSVVNEHLSPEDVARIDRLAREA